MPLLIPVAFAATASALTTAWHEFIHREREKRRHEEMCRHIWGEVKEVASAPLGPGPKFYKQWCRACPAQRNVNADGTPYVPLHERRD